ncbi:aminopeptidase N-like isoform X1 [Formica exsecta]|uniref:aminopeptidase N-like isoform X1 n=1 Tax=Formica exsecta TaxID=72781 RepID=UPI0011413D08|nr:aminopeptidase N-like isoform X1 [Formica exsecta]
MKYYGIISDDDAKSTTIYKRKDEWWLIPTHFDVLGARQVFPSLGEFFPATFNISIRHHRNYAALSNMAVQKVEINNADMALTHFETTPVLPTYLIAGMVTNFYRNSTKNMNTNVWYRNCSAMHMVFAQRAIERITLSLESEWKLRVISKLDHVAIPKFQDKGMVNLGLVLYREEDIIYDEKLDSAARKVDVARIIGFKVLQEWFYNIYELVRTSYKSFWFNDCFIRFFGTYTVHKVFPELRIMDLFVIQFHHESLDFDTNYDTFPFNDSFEFPGCIKVSIMLRMLKNILTEKIFWSAIRTYINNDPDYKNLVRSLNESMDGTILSLSTMEKYKSELLNMIHINDSWTKQNDYPTLNVKRDYNHPYGKMELLIENYNASYHYCIFLTYTIQTDLNFDDISLPYLLNETRPFFYLDTKEDGWVIFNLQQIGYYRVNYDIENWKRIANYLASENYMKIHVLNRAQIINDAFHFMITKQLDSSIFWKITEYLVRETDYVAWYPMFKAMEYMSSVFPLPGEKANKIKIRMRSILRGVLQELKYEEIANEDDFRKRLRQEAAKWACSLDDYKCKETASRKLERHLTNPKKHKLLPWWKEWTFCKGLMLLSKPIGYENSIWSAMYRMGMNKSKTKFLEFLACPDDPDFIISYLSLIDYQMRLDYDLHNENYSICFLFAIARHANKDEVLKHILINFEDIKPEKISTAVTLTVLINHLYSKEQLTEVSKFLTNQLEKVESYALRRYEKHWKSLYKNFEINFEMVGEWKKVEQQNKIIQSKLDIRSHQIESQIKYLDTI